MESNTPSEIDDLRAYIEGLPQELRDGPYGEVYRKRLRQLEAQERREKEG